MAGTNFRIRIVVATVGVIQVLNVIIEDGVGNDTAVYAFETAGFIATRITGSPQAVHSGGMAFITPRRLSVTQFGGTATIRPAGGGVVGGMGWKLEVRTAAGLLQIPFNPGGIDMLSLPSQGALRLLP